MGCGNSGGCGGNGTKKYKLLDINGLQYIADVLAGKLFTVYGKLKAVATLPLRLGVVLGSGNCTIFGGKIDEGGEGEDGKSSSGFMTAEEKARLDEMWKKYQDGDFNCTCERDKDTEPGPETGSSGGEDPNFQYPEGNTVNEEGELTDNAINLSRGTTAWSERIYYFSIPKQDEDYELDFRIALEHGWLGPHDNDTTPDYTDIEIESDYEGMTVELGEREQHTSDEYRHWGAILRVPASVLANIPDDKNILLGRMRIKQNYWTGIEQGRESIFNIFGYPSGYSGDVNVVDDKNMGNVCSLMRCAYIGGSYSYYATPWGGTNIARSYENSISGVSTGDKLVYELEEGLDFIIHQGGIKINAKMTLHGTWLISRLENYVDKNGNSVIGSVACVREEVPIGSIEVSSDETYAILHVEPTTFKFTIGDLPTSNGKAFSIGFSFSANDVEIAQVGYIGLLKGCTTKFYLDTGEETEEPDPDDGDGGDGGDTGDGGEPDTGGDEPNDGDGDGTGDDGGDGGEPDDGGDTGEEEPDGDN